jgi:hypothetical protein
LGQAQEDIYEAVKNKKSLIDILEMVQQQYAKKRTITDDLKDIEAITRKPGESIHSLAQRSMNMVEKLRHLSSPSYWPEKRREIMTKIIKSAIHKDVRQKIEANEFIQIKATGEKYQFSALLDMIDTMENTEGYLPDSNQQLFNVSNIEILRETIGLNVGAYRNFRDIRERSRSRESHQPKDDKKKARKGQKRESSATRNQLSKAGTSESESLAKTLASEHNKGQSGQAANVFTATGFAKPLKGPNGETILPVRGGPPVAQLLKKPVDRFVPNYVSPETIKQAIRYAQKQGFDVSSPPKLASYYSSGKKLPGRKPTGYTGSGERVHYKDGKLVKLIVEDGTGYKTLVMCGSRFNCNSLHPADEVCPMEIVAQKAEKSNPTKEQPSTQSQSSTSSSDLNA